ncbi:MAG TPA: molybdenum cofactor biosynthesis protein MoaE [Bacteroidia bacterium]|jgi:molybdopterin synthase catalytic subunit|nr:molybdenum cofactor biosynthesis protein MoaE [Bacteroidia bacterium]
MNTPKPRHTVLQQGPISPAFIAESIAKHSAKTKIGAHTIFLGQVRADAHAGKIVQSIEYSAYEAMAEKEFHKIREAAFERYELSCLHIHHSVGVVKAGEISLFVFVSAVHRKEVFEACSFIVEQIKLHIPVWGKEVADDGTYVWKENKSEKN